MIARVIDDSVRESQRQARYLKMLPAIRRQASIAFQMLNAEAKEDAVVEVVANAYCAFMRLVEQGREHHGHPTTLTEYAIRHFSSGRRIGTKFNSHEIMCRRTQLAHG